MHFKTIIIKEYINAIKRPILFFATNTGCKKYIKRNLSVENIRQIKTSALKVFLKIRIENNISQRTLTLQDILIIVTLAIILFSITLFTILDKNYISSFGSYIGGIATSIAILWIVYNSMIQAKSIELQQQELELQREATQKIAHATQLETFFKFFDLSSRILSKNAEEIIEIMFEKTKQDKTYLNEMKRKYRLGDTDVYFRHMSTNEIFIKWVKTLRKDGDDHITLSRIEAFCEKYNILIRELDSFSDSKEIKTLLFNSSELARSIRSFEQSI